MTIHDTIPSPPPPAATEYDIEVALVEISSYTHHHEDTSGCAPCRALEALMYRLPMPPADGTT